MSFHEMKIQGAWVHTPLRYQDSRGHFEEQFKLSAIERELTLNFQVKQTNQSVSQKGVIRGIHWTDSPQGQAKFVSCMSGSIWDVVVDLRPESSTYGQWDAVEVTPQNGKSVVLSRGLGHAFLALEEGTLVNYLCTSEYDPLVDRTINPLDPVLNINFLEIAKSRGIQSLTMSDRDRDGEAFKSS
jgi:dTDP-4-dehydrorhamnose 3,5-epimerase